MTIPQTKNPAPSLLALLAVALLASCGDRESTHEIADVRTRPAEPATAQTPAQPSPEWGYVLPEGWKPLPKRPMVELAFQVAGNEDAQCTFSILPGGAGGLGANVDRWRKQMGLEPLPEAERAAKLEALERRTVLGENAVVVDLEGTYGGMRGDVGLEDARMYGLIFDVPRSSVFLKMVGPAAVVEGELESFHKLTASLRPPPPPLPPGAQTMPAGHPPIPGMGGPAATPPGTPEMPAGHPPVPPGMGGAQPPAPSPIRWKAPEGWEQGPPKMMREVTFRPGGSEATEVYVSIARGAVGENLNRWRGQMSQESLSEEEIAALPRVAALGREGVLVEIVGSFRGGMGAKKIEDAAMLGFVLPREDDSVFVKMIGPKAEVLAERDAFQAFCASLAE